MPSFPQIRNLPAALDSTGWKWERYQPPAFPWRDAWLGTDTEGNTWLTKLRGGFYAYRELVFARLAQKMGWSCQSSAFMRLDPRSAEVLGVSVDEDGDVHAAHWFMAEHPQTTCSPECPLAFLRRPIRTVDELVGSRIAHLLDWPKSEVAACLFGGNEPPDRLFTTAHEFVIIDSEQMFSSDPCDLTETNWWDKPDGSPSLSGRRLTYEVCRDLCRLSELDLQEALRLPETISIEELWPIAPKLYASRAFARRFLAAQAWREGDMSDEAR